MFVTDSLPPSPTGSGKMGPDGCLLSCWTGLWALKTEVFTLNSKHACHLLWREDFLYLFNRSNKHPKSLLKQRAPILCSQESQKHHLPKQNCPSTKMKSDWVPPGTAWCRAIVDHQQRLISNLFSTKWGQKYNTSHNKYLQNEWMIDHKSRLILGRAPTYATETQRISVWDYPTVSGSLDLNWEQDGREGLWLSSPCQPGQEPLLGLLSLSVKKRSLAHKPTPHNSELFFLKRSFIKTKSSPS